MDWKKERKIRMNDVIVGQKCALKIPWIGNTLAVQQMASKTQLTQIISQQQKPQVVMIFARKKHDHSEWKVFVKVRKKFEFEWAFDWFNKSEKKPLKIERKSVFAKMKRSNFINQWGKCVKSLTKASYKHPSIDTIRRNR